MRLAALKGAGAPRRLSQTPDAPGVGDGAQGLLEQSPHPIEVFGGPVIRRTAPLRVACVPL